MRLSWLVSHDPATGFYNSRASGPLLERLVADAKAHGHQHALCYLHVLGPAGVAGNHENDQLLRVVSNGLHSWLPPKVTIVRLHALHFALLVPGCSAQEAEQIVEALLNSIQVVHLNASGKSLPVGANIGVILIRPQTASAETALKAAENACWEAATYGPNQFHMG